MKLNLVIRLTTYTLFILVLQSFIAVSAERLQHKTGVLMLAKPTEVKFKINIGNLPENKNSGKAYYGAIYSVKLRNIRVLKGKFDKNYLEVDMRSAHEESLTKPSELLVYVEFDRDGNALSVGWWYILKFACLDPDVIGELSLSEVFDEGFDLEGDRCIDIGALSPE